MALVGRAPARARRGRRAARPASAALCIAERTSGWRNSSVPSVNAHEPGRLGLLQRCDVDSQLPGGLRDRTELGRRRGRGDEQGAPRHLRQPRARPAKERSTVVAIGSGPSTRLAATVSASPASSISASGLPPVARNSRSALPGGTAPSRVARAAPRRRRGRGRQLEHGQSCGRERGRLARCASRRRSRQGRRAAAGRRTGSPRRTAGRADGHRRSARTTAAPRRPPRARRASRLRSPGARRRYRGRARAPSAAPRPGAPAAPATWSSTGRSSSSRPANGIDPSCSIPRAASTRIPPARSAASARRALLPMPGSPRTSSAPLVPTRASARRRSIAARSVSRPSSIGRVCPRAARRAVGAPLPGGYSGAM